MIIKLNKSTVESIYIDSNNITYFRALLRETGSYVSCKYPIEGRTWTTVIESPEEIMAIINKGEI